MRELVVISPAGDSPGEISILAQLCAIGLERYHVRKPNWSAGRLADWLETVPAELRPRLVLHSHHELVEQFGLAGRHWRDEPGTPLRPEVGQGVTSCSCHRLEDLVARVGCYDSIFFSPMYPSASKPERPPLSSAALAAVANFLRHRTREERHTKVIALSGVTPRRVAECAAWGFDGVAVMGGLAAGAGPGQTPLLRFRQYQNACSPVLSPIMCLTQDGLGPSHLDQIRELCAAGARCIQLRVKGAAEAQWLALAREATQICHAHGALCLINDRPDFAAAAGADGAHVGNADGDWHQARRILGRGKILGGTVNNLEEATRAVQAGCLDYVGVGPLHFTTTKQKLAPVLEIAGVRQVIAALGDLPAWVIGGVQAGDLAPVCGAGASGVAVSSALYRGTNIAAQFTELVRGWPMAAARSLAELSPSVV